MSLSSFQHPLQVGYSPVNYTSFQPSFKTVNTQYDNMDSPPMMKQLVTDDEFSDALDFGDPLLTCKVDTTEEFFTNRLSKAKMDVSLKVCQMQPYDIIPDTCSDSMSTAIRNAIDIKPRVMGDEVTCIEVNELWDMCAILCEILAHYDPSTGKLIANEFGDVQKMLSKIVKGEGLSRLYKNFRVDEETDKIKYRYKTAAGRLGKDIEKQTVII